LKRTVAEILRRGFENMVANWPLLAIRIAEGVVFVMMFLAGAIAIVVPFLVSIGLSRESLPSEPADVAAAILDALIAHWLVIVYAIIVVSIVLLLVIAIHSFVVSGCARVYVDGEKRSASLPVGARGAFAAFSADRWFRGGWEGWWPVFWIYNIAWSVGGLIVLFPMMVVMLLMIAFRGAAAVAAGIGCLGLIFTMFFGIVVAVVTNVWTQKAIVDCVARHTGAMRALRSSWSELRADTGRHIVVALVMMAMTFAGSMLFSSFSWLGAFSRDATSHLFLMPFQFTSSILNSIFSAAIACWFLASFAALAVERRA
jgi:hypothetical protein